MSWLRASLRRNRTPILRNVAPETVLEAFRMHWLRTQQIMEKSSLSGTKPTADDITGILNHLDQMVNFLVEEATTSRNSTTLDGQCSTATPNDTSSGQVLSDLGPIVDYLLAEGVLDKLFQWSLQAGEFLPVLKLEQLRVYEVLVSHSQHELLLQHGFLRPLLHLLGSCGECGSPVEVEKRLVVLLNTLCVSLSQHPHLLQLFFTTGSHQPASSCLKAHSEGEPKDTCPCKLTGWFLIFSLLIPFVHREGGIGQQARDALLLCMALSRKNQSVGLYIAEHSNFCPVLATGLSGLYSVLPRKLSITAEDWHRLTPEDIQELPELAMFLNSLEFCNAVIQVSHPTVQEQLLEYIYQGFLVPVLVPALHQNTLEEIVTATAYLELFLRTVTEPQLLMVLFRFVLTEKYENHLVLNTLINRLGSHSKLCLVTMALFRTLLDFNCEDVMLELVFKYLIPCSHVMVSQRSRVRDVDFYSTSAEKFLSLIPSSCHTSSSDESPVSRNLRHQCESLPDDTREGSFRAKSGQRRSISTTFLSLDSSASESVKTAQNGSQWHLTDDTGYHLYLLDARRGVRAARQACSAWSSSYDGSSDTNGVTPDRTEFGDEGSVSAGDSGVFVTKEGVKGGFEAFGSPDIGPFLGVLLARLEMMPQNDVYTNLQLTALVSRLALYPQPLLRSFLLSHSLVFQPSIRSLFQVLGSLKHKVDSYSHTLPNFEELLGRARQFFAMREERLLGEGPPRHYGGDPPVRRSYSFSQGFIRGDAKRRSFSNLFRRLGDRGSQRAPALESIPDQKGYRYIPAVSRDTEDDLKLESIKTRHAMLGAVVLEEFLKELAAISQEHAVQQLAL